MARLTYVIYPIFIPRMSHRIKPTFLTDKEEFIKLDSTSIGIYAVFFIQIA